VWRAHQNFKIVRRIHEEVAALCNASVPIHWHWTPSHEDIHGNEYADKLAKRAAFSIQHVAPRFIPAPAENTYPQPEIPISVSRSLTRTSISNQQVESWYRTFASHIGLDHLSRIQLSNRFNPRFSVGSRYTQTILAQLRFGHS